MLWTNRAARFISFSKRPGNAWRRCPKQRAGRRCSRSIPRLPLEDGPACSNAPSASEARTERAGSFTGSRRATACRQTRSVRRSVPRLSSCVVATARRAQALLSPGAAEWRIARQAPHGSQAHRPRVGRSDSSKSALSHAHTIGGPIRGVPSALGIHPVDLRVRRLRRVFCPAGRLQRHVGRPATASPSGRPPPCTTSGCALRGWPSPRRGPSWSRCPRPSFTQLFVLKL